MMVDAGLTPMQAIVSATGDAARCHHKAGEMGTLAAGGAADLVDSEREPLENIRNTRNIDRDLDQREKGLLISDLRSQIC
jgi:imidazolonepropionase-like amidohydrolase